MQSNPFQSQKFREKKKKQKKIKQILIISISLVCLIFLIYITNASFLRVQRIVVNDVQYSNRNDIELAIKNQIDSRYFGLFAKSNIFILPRNKIYREIKNNYPSIKSIDLDITGLTEISVELGEYTANAIWCDVPVTPVILSTPTETEGEKVSSSMPQVVSNFSSANCFFLNDSGVVFAKTDYDNNSDVVKTFGFITSDPIRKNYADKDTFLNLVEFTKLLRRLNIVADQVWTTDGEIYAVVTTDKVKIYIDGESNILEIFDNLETVIKRDAINQAQFGNIDYIDLRFGNRVFYKLK